MLKMLIWWVTELNQQIRDQEKGNLKGKGRSLLTSNAAFWRHYDDSYLEDRDKE